LSIEKGFACFFEEVPLNSKASFFLFLPRDANMTRGLPSKIPIAIVEVAAGTLGQIT